MHRRTIIGTGLALPLAAAAAKGEGVAGEVDLSRCQLGPLLPEFLTTWRTGKGAPGDWRIVAEPTAAQGKAIAELNADATDYRFPRAVYEPLPAKFPPAYGTRSAFVPNAIGSRLHSMGSQR